MAIHNLKIGNYLLEDAIKHLERDGEDVRTLKVYKADLEEKIEGKSISTFSKLSKLKKLNDNQQLVLDTLKEEYGQEYIFDDIAHFADCYRYKEESNSEVLKAYLELNTQEEIEVLKHYIEYLEDKENEQC